MISINFISFSPNSLERNVAINLFKNEALKVFINGLNPPVALVVKYQMPSTLENTISLTRQEEQTQKSRYKIQKCQQVNSSSARFCSYCYKSGHTSFNCGNIQNSNFLKPINNYLNFRHVSNPNQSNYNPPRFTNQYNQLKICKYCKNPSHLINECRKREFNNKRKQNDPNIQSGTHTSSNQN